MSSGLKVGSLDLRRVTLEVLTPCETCEESRTVYDPYGFWREANEFLNGLEERGVDPSDRADEFECWCHAKGYSMDQLPPEEGNCSDCEGTGRHSVRVSLVQLRDALSAVPEVKTRSKAGPS